MAISFFTFFKVRHYKSLGKPKWIETNCYTSPLFMLILLIFWGKRAYCNEKKTLY